MEIINIVLAISTLAIGIVIVRLTSKYVEKMKETKTFKSLLRNSEYNEVILWYLSYFIKLGAYIIISLIAISFLGFAQEFLTLIAIIITLSIIGVLLYSIRDLIPSAFAGAYIIRSKLIKKGDRIKVQDFEGTVKEVNLLTLTLETEKEQILIVPNKIIMEKIIKKK